MSDSDCSGPWSFTKIYKISAALGTYFWIQRVRILAKAPDWQACTHSDYCNSNMTMHLNARHVFMSISTVTPCSLIAGCCTKFRNCRQESSRYACCDLRCQNVRHASYPIQQGFSRSSDDLGYLCWKRQAMIPLTNGFKSQLDELLMAALIQVRSGAAVRMQISTTLPYNLISSIKIAASTF